MWKDIFSHVKNNKVMLFSLFVSDNFGSLHCFLKNADPTSIFCTALTSQFLNKTNMNLIGATYIRASNLSSHAS